METTAVATLLLRETLRVACFPARVRERQERTTQGTSCQFAQVGKPIHAPGSAIYCLTTDPSGDARSDT
nr:hypothetical protein [Dendronalium sp. ChiSLP03b]